MPEEAGFDKSKEFCSLVMNGSVLPVPNNEADMACIDRLRGSKTVWLGFHRESSDGYSAEQYLALDNSGYLNKDKFQKWLPSQPAEILQKRCAAATQLKNGQAGWFTDNCVTRYSVICQDLPGNYLRMSPRLCHVRCSNDAAFVCNYVHAYEVAQQSCAAHLVMVL